MEFTGKYWVPIFNVLEDSCHVVIANPKYVRAIKGQKTDDKDATWIADLFKFDIVPSSYIPTKAIRMLRELCRYRTKLVGTRSSEKNRLQNSLTVSNIVLGSVLTDTFGKSSSAILDYLLNCDVFDPEHCKSLLKRKRKTKRLRLLIPSLAMNFIMINPSKCRFVANTLTISLRVFLLLMNQLPQ